MRLPGIGSPLSVVSCHFRDFRDFRDFICILYKISDVDPLFVRTAKSEKISLQDIRRAFQGSVCRYSPKRFFGIQNIDTLGRRSRPVHIERRQRGMHPKFQSSLAVGGCL